MAVKTVSTKTAKAAPVETEQFKAIKISNEADNPNMTLEIIGPKLATKYLALAAPNRIIRDPIIAKYARDMQADNWYSSVIRFGIDGLMHDGQHRCKAVILSKTEQLFWVERNVPLEAFRSVDTGIKRTLGDQFAIAGEQNTNVLATGVRYAAWLENFPGVALSSTSQLPMSNEEAFWYLDNNPGLRASVHIALKMQPLRYSPSLAAALHYLAVKDGNEAQANNFWEQMVSGANMQENTAPYTLRQQVIENQMRLGANRMDRNMLFAISIKAWNYWKYNLPVRRLRWLRNADEPFPTFGKRP